MRLGLNAGACEALDASLCIKPLYVCSIMHKEWDGGISCMFFALAVADLVPIA